MAMFVDVQPRKKCWNLQAICCGICEQCGCCASDPVEQCKNRIRLLEAELDDNINFDRWFEDDPELMALQKRNIESNIKHIRQKLAWYKQRLKELGGTENG